MATQQQQQQHASYEDFLETAPSLKELTEYIYVGTKWYTLGIILEVDQKKLQGIEELTRDDVYKTTKMFELWLSGTSKNRSQVLKALRKRAVGETAVAKEYEDHLRELHAAECAAFQSSEKCTTKYGIQGTKGIVREYSETILNFYIYSLFTAAIKHR